MAPGCQYPIRTPASPSGVLSGCLDEPIVASAVLVQRKPRPSSSDFSALSSPGHDYALLFISADLTIVAKVPSLPQVYAGLHRTRTLPDPANPFEFRPGAGVQAARDAP